MGQVGGASVRGSVVRNTIIYGNSPSDFDGYPDSSLEFCWLWSDDPLLTPDFRLKANSPCIDAGTASNAPPTDMDGEARWDDPRHSNVVSIVDIGADEFVDTDLDSMADFWEALQFGSITYKDGTADGDNDALNDLAEYNNATAPTNSDTDADQMPDGWEVHFTLNPLTNDAALDPDSDGAPNLAEYVADTDPTNPLSVLSFLHARPEAGGMRLDWKGGVQAWQFLESRESLTSTNESWLPLLAIPPPTPLTNAVIDMGATNHSLFYRIRVER